MTFLNAYMFYLKGCYDNSYTQKSINMYNIYIQRRFQDFSQGGPTFPHKTTKMQKYPFVSVSTNLTGSNHEDISGFVLLVFYHFLFFSRGV